MAAPVPTLYTSRLLLRELCEADIPAYDEHFIDYEVVSYLTDQVPWPYPEGGVRDYLELINGEFRPRQTQLDHE